jgi:phenylpropionate dioxygenase-like ring-hydroxylating dioxygenase large terminal subunit
VHRDSKAEVRKHLLHFIDTRTTDYADSVMWVEARRYYEYDYLTTEFHKIIRVHPMIAAHASELPGPGHEVTVNAIGTPLRLVRAEDGTVRAHHADHPAVEYPADEYGGLIWVRLSPGGPLDMARYAGPDMDRDVQASRVGQAKLYRKEEFHLAMNWKLVMDGFTDAYHLQFVHPETVGPFFHTNIYKADVFGKNWRMVTARKGIEEFRAEEVDWDEFAQYAIYGFNFYPASMIARAPAHFEVWSIRPDHDDLRKCYVTLYFLVPELPVTDRAKRFRERNWDIVIRAVRDEDWAVARTVGDSLVSGALSHLVYGRNEKATQIFHGQLDRDMSG